MQTGDDSSGILVEVVRVGCVCVYQAGAQQTLPCLVVVKRVIACQEVEEVRPGLGCKECNQLFATTRGRVEVALQERTRVIVLMREEIDQVASPIGAGIHRMINDLDVQ